MAEEITEVPSPLLDAGAMVRVGNGDSQVFEVALQRLAKLADDSDAATAQIVLSFIGDDVEVDGRYVPEIIIRVVEPPTS